MAQRRVEKMSRLIKELVSEVLMYQLSDPRIEGVISVTRVEMTPDLKIADVYLSIFGGDQKKQELTFNAIKHASSHIRSLIAKDITARYLPRLDFYMDETHKKTLETLNLIDEVSKEFKDKDEQQEDTEE